MFYVLSIKTSYITLNESHCGAHGIGRVLQVYMKQFFFYRTVFRLKNEKNKFVEKERKGLFWSLEVLKISRICAPEDW